MNARALIFFLAVIPALSGCAEDFRLADPLAVNGALCRKVTHADTAWQAGCATKRNLAALAEEPDDLYMPRSETPREAVRRDRIFDRYGRSAIAAWQNAGIRTGSGSDSIATTGAAE